MDDGTGGFLIALLVTALVAASVAINDDVNVTQNEMNKGNTVCLNEGGLQYLGKDNGGSYTAYCVNNTRYEYTMPEKKQ